MAFVFSFNVEYNFFELNTEYYLIALSIKLFIF